MAENDTKKANLANLSKIPATEFEKHFHEWMERDDVARGLQAKLRCDLIKNFNKTNLGKQIMAHTMSSTGGSTYRLTLTPLVLALNTLVAEFLYAQNCHFTLSVFCTEIPFHNTLPDFESMRNYRFSAREIMDIWEAVTGAAASKRYLDTTILEDYETNTSNSLLLLFLKSLVDMKPPEMLRKSVEIQTECDAAACHDKRSTSVQATQQSPVKSTAKGPDNLRHINKYLLILSQKVNEMTHEFELLVKQRNIQKPQQPSAVKTTRSREMYTLNRSLDRINENVKQLTKSKRKGKRLTNIVESIDSLTKQFGKCAESFGQVTKELTKKEKKQAASSQPQPSPVNFKEKQTETEAQEKTYSDWIYEMRTTDNGKKFLERVENSLSKAVAKHKEQWQIETNVKMKQMKSLIKLHYKQKMLMHLSRQGSEEHANEARKLNETIELRLKHFEIKQFELLQKLRESSFELQEAQKQLHEQTDRSEEESDRMQDKKVVETEKGNEMQKEPEQIDQGKVIEKEKRPKTPQSSAVEKPLAAEVVITEPPIQVKDPANVHKKLQDLASTITPRDHNVERIINNAKLRLQQLETESNCLETHFQIYLERRKKEHKSRQETSHKLISQSLSKTSEIFRNFGRKDSLAETSSSKCLLHNIQSKPCPTEDDLDFDDEFLRLKEKLKETQLEVEMADNNGSPSSSEELKNAILDAKYKFFENEQMFRQRKEKELLQQCEPVPLTEQLERNIPDFASISYNYGAKSNRSLSQNTEKEQIIVFNINSSASNVSNREIPLDVEAQNHNEDRRNASDGNTKSPRRELFPKESLVKDSLNSIENVRYIEPISVTSRDLRKALKDLKTYTQNMDKKDDKSTESTGDLIKQSMAKMKQLFEEQPKDERETAKPKENNSDSENQMQTSTLRDCLDTSVPDINLTASTTTTSHTTTTATSATSATVDLAPKRQVNLLKSVSIIPTPSIATAEYGPTTQVDLFKSDSFINRISNTSMPSLINLTSDSEESLKSENRADDASDNDDDDDIDESSSEREILTRDGNPIPELLITPKGDSLEIGEILSEARQKCVPMPAMTSSESSEHTDSEFDISLGRDDKKVTSTAKMSDESESDFWA